MEISSFRSIAELGMDDPRFFHQWPANYLEELNSASLFCEDLNQSISQQPVVDFKQEAQIWSQTVVNRPFKHLKTENMSNSPLPVNAHLMMNSNFTHNPAGIARPKEESWSSYNAQNVPSESVVSQSIFGNQNFILKPCHGVKRISTNTRLAQAQDHILAERNRREKLSQRFIALSALVPGLKKMDKASVLGDAVKHMKHLQEKVKILEEQSKKRSIESVVFVNRHQLYADAGSPSSDGNLSSGPTVTEPLPEIQVRFSTNEVLIIIHCEKRKGVVEKAVSEIEKLHLSVVNSSVMTFEDSVLNITVIAQKDKSFTMNTEELMKNLRGALKTLM